VGRHEWMRAASSGREDIMSVRWAAEAPGTPEAPEAPRAIIQIAHGMAEHTGRYDDLAGFFARNGFSVYMNETAGHGPHAETLGYFADKDGMDYVIADMKSLEEIAREENPGAPVFLLGHSMGSFISRKYITIYGNDLAGCLLSGTAGRNPAAPVGMAIASLQKKVRGSKSQGKLLSAMTFGSYNKRIENPVNSYAWLSRDDEVCKSYRSDKYCGFPFTASGYYDLLVLLREISSDDWACKVPDKLPILIYAGDSDPVGAYGKGPVEVRDKLAKAGVSDVTLKLYPGGRHEMHNELNKQEVYQDILNWLTARIPD